MSLLRNSLANFMGGALPAVVMLVTTPYIVWQLGLVDYGLLTVISAIVGYFSFIDINLTAGAIKYVAQYRARGDAAREAQTIVLGLGVYLAIGIVGGLLLWGFAAPLVGGVFDIPEARRAEAARCLEVAALGFLLGQIQQYLNSLPQAIQRYDVSARLEAVFGTLVPLLSVLALWLGGGLFELIALRVAASGAHALLLAAACRPLFPEFRFSLPEADLARTVLSFSGFSYLSKIAALTYEYADRLIIGAVLGMEAVTLYSVPATLINRFTGLTFRLSSVVFPAASDLAERRDWDRLRQVYFAYTRNMAYLNGAFIVTLVLFAEEILHYWIGAEIAERGWAVMTLIGLAMLFDSFTNVPSLVNDGLGHARVSGLFAVSRAIFALLITALAVHTAWGIVAVAAGHLLASLAAGGLFLAYVHARTIPYPLGDYLARGVLPPVAWLAGVAALGYLLTPAGLLGLPATMLGGALVGAAFLLAGWFGILSADERAVWLARLPLAQRPR
jgi:O-antigen/teichoic acid export membrane protein